MSEIGNHERSLVDNPTQNVSFFLHILSHQPHGWNQTAAILLLIFCFLLLILYTHVLVSIVKGKLWKQGIFYLQLIELGVHEILTLILYCFYLIMSACSSPFSLDLRVLVALGGVQYFLFAVAVWLILEMAMVRAAVVYFPITAFTAATSRFGNKAKLCLLIAAYVYAGVCVAVTRRIYAIYIPAHLIWVPMMEVGEAGQCRSHEGGGGALS